MDCRATNTYYGYNWNGALTYFRDANGRVTTYSVNAWDLTETTTEPWTSAHRSLGDRQFTTIYDADGNVFQEREPGGLLINYFRNEFGDVTRAEGRVNGGVSGMRLFTYRADRLVASQYNPTGTEYYTYDDRGYLLESRSHSNAISTVFSYDRDGRMTGRHEKINGQSYNYRYTWTSQGELKTHVDSVAGSTATFQWNNASQLTRIDQAGSVRTFSYTAWGELRQDQFRRSDGVWGARSHYYYDDRGDVARVWKSAAGQGTHNHLYSYDAAGRLVSWTVKNSNQSFTHEHTTYKYDRVGNRTERHSSVDGLARWGYDQRNRLLWRSATGESISYRWDARGTLASELASPTGEWTFFDFDGFGRMTRIEAPNNQTVSISYDSNDRMTKRLGAGHFDVFFYAGFSQDPAAIRGFNDIDVFGRSPSGQLRSVLDTAGNRRIAGMNRHGDLEWLSPGAPMTETVVYEPFGEEYKRWGNDPDTRLGFQGDYTEPAGIGALVGCEALAAGVAGAAGNLAGGRNVTEGLGTDVVLGGVFAGGGAAAGSVAARFPLQSLVRQTPPTSSTIADELTIDRVVLCAVPGRSFSGDTYVLLADGSTVAMEDIEVGDVVWATEPELGVSGPREVLATWPHEDTLVEFETTAGTIVTTEDHHFWNVTDQAWQETQDLDRGDQLLTPDGTVVEAIAINWSTAHDADAYDLTIDDIHTYYVVTDDAAVLVHNTNHCPGQLQLFNPDAPNPPVVDGTPGGSPALDSNPWSPGEVSRRQSDLRRSLQTGNYDPDSPIPDQSPGRDTGGHTATQRISHDGQRNIGAQEEHSRRAKGNRFGGF